MPARSFLLGNRGTLNPAEGFKTVPITLTMNFGDDLFVDLSQLQQTTNAISQCLAVRVDVLFTSLGPGTHPSIHLIWPTGQRMTLPFQLDAGEFETIPVLSTNPIQFRVAYNTGSDFGPITVTVFISNHQFVDGVIYSG